MMRMLSAQKKAKVSDRARPDIDTSTARFEIDWEVKHRLVSGLDDIAVTLAEDAEAIDDYERRRDPQARADRLQIGAHQQRR